MKIEMKIKTFNINFYICNCQNGQSSTHCSNQCDYIFIPNCGKYAQENIKKKKKMLIQIKILTNHYHSWLIKLTLSKTVISIIHKPG